ncbi:hypothetical protein ACRJ4B_10425 [Streptomyces sp. GTA36]
MTHQNEVTPIRTAPVLSAEGLCKSYNGVPVLDHIDFSVASGDVKAVLGGSRVRKIDDAAAAGAA